MMLSDWSLTTSKNTIREILSNWPVILVLKCRQDSWEKVRGSICSLKNHKCIFLNEDLEEHERTLVMAHELAHSIMHRKENCYFIRNRTLMLTSKIEIEANTFAAELLIPDEMIVENPGLTKAQIACLAGYDERIMEFKKGLS